jgi:tetratricopeptide (TPR) repeat protein
MGSVRHVCGECGAEVQRADAHCRACGKSLEWGEARGAAVRSQPGRTKTANAGASRRRRFEPWQVISMVAVGVLVVYIVWTEMSREHVIPVAGASQAPVTQMPQLGAPPVDTAPLEAAVAANPKDARALLHLANAYHDNGMVPRAIEQYKKYLGLQPDNPDARVDLGICYDQMGMADSVQAEMYYAQAIKEMETALTKNPSHQPAAFNLGIVNLHRGDLTESNKWLTKAAAMNRNSDLGMRAQQILQQHSFTP